MKNLNIRGPKWWIFFHWIQLQHKPFKWFLLLLSTLQKSLLHFLLLSVFLDQSNSFNFSSCFFLSTAQNSSSPSCLPASDNCHNIIELDIQHLPRKLLQNFQFSSFFKLLVAHCQLHELFISTSFTSTLSFSIFAMPRSLSSLVGVAAVSSAFLPFDASCLSLDLCLLVNVVFVFGVMVDCLLLQMNEWMKDQSFEDLQSCNFSSMTLHVFVVLTTSLSSQGWRCWPQNFQRNFIMQTMSSFGFGLVVWVFPVLVHKWCLLGAVWCARSQRLCEWWTCWRKFVVFHAHSTGFLSMTCLGQSIHIWFFWQMLSSCRLLCL